MSARFIIPSTLHDLGVVESVDGAKTGTDRSIHAAGGVGVYLREDALAEWSVPVFASCG